ncbi:RES family NAD+ phosphorylase [Maribellus maritimus]|uniref:RES family NAD+ phosphorylase n=1 Tax=Maribellus maritimus TaxID=2870838 RepID=UPI001EECEB5F|nr:RES family NAD+ phosphorylase [Maribellus maritimus]MCG6190070.1 RES family NAD+ phosphorylase [Maribellus maritimus]
MFVYRIAHKEHSALDGVGGVYGTGRWHRKGSLIIYTSEHASLAAWEKLVHITSLENLPNNLLLIKIEIPENIEAYTVPKEVLVKGWDGFPFTSETINYGTSFLRERKYLALKVPSVVIPEEYNIILNPLHLNFRSCKIVSKVPFIFDKRISQNG